MPRRKGPIVIFIIFFSFPMFCGCIDQKDNGDEQGYFDDTISVKPPFSDLGDTNFLVDENDNIHFIWIDCHHKDISFYHEVKYSKYNSEMVPIVENLTICGSLMAFLGEHRDLSMVVDS